jgi:Excalibur calcium-binding domain
LKTRLVLAVALALLVMAPTAAARMPLLYRSCAHLHTKYPHGVGRAKARDRTTGTQPVTTFRRSDKLFALVMSYNRGLDRDHDGIACEQE